MRISVIALTAAVLLVQPGHAPAQWDNRNPQYVPGDDTSPKQEEALSERNRQRLQKAEETGESFTPIVPGQVQTQPPNTTLQPPPKNIGTVQQPEKKEPEKKEPEATAAKPPPPKQPRPPDQPQQPTPVYDAPARQPDGPADLLGALLETWAQPPQVVRLRYPAPEPQEPQAGEPAPESPPAAQLPGISPGTLLYARTIIGVNSDHPGPVLIEILQPPLAGATAIGSFTVVRDRLAIRIATIHWRGRTVRAEAWGVGLETASYALTAKVDRHWFSRLVLPSAIRFAEGFLAASAEPTRTITLADGATLQETQASTERQALQAGGAAALRQAGDILLETAPPGPTVRMPANTELAIIFTTSLPIRPTPAAAQEARNGSQ